MKHKNYFRLNRRIALFIGSIAFVAFIGSSIALELDFQVGKAKESFGILTLKNDEPFLCEHEFKTIDDEDIRCIIKTPPKEGFLPFESSFFQISHEVKNKQFILHIQQRFKEKDGKKAHQKLFLIQDNIKDGVFLDYDPAVKTNITPIDSKDKTYNAKVPITSRSFQIISYIDELPFLSKDVKRSDLAINFPIILPQNNDFMPNLGANFLPLAEVSSKDYEDYQKAKLELDKKNFALAIQIASQTLKEYPNSIFEDDLQYIQIKALKNLGYNQEALNLAKSWLIKYARNDRASEVIYLSAQMQDALSLPTQSEHLYRRLLSEYENDVFSPLARMQLALKDAKRNDISGARNKFSQSLEDAKTIDSAVEIALNWATIEAKNKADTNANARVSDLVDKIVGAKSKYLVDNDKKTEDFINLLIDNGLYKDAAKIADLAMRDAQKNDPIHEFATFKLGEIYEKDKQFEKAHNANNEFLEIYGSQKTRSKVVIARDDALLFDINTSDEKKIEHYNYLISKYPNTEIAQKALDQKAKLELSIGKFEDVITLKNKISQSLIDSAHAGLINKATDYYNDDAIKSVTLRANTCQVIASNAAQMASFGEIKDKILAFDCLFDGRLYDIAKHLIPDLDDLKKDVTNPKYLEWLYRSSKNNAALHNYKQALIDISTLNALAAQNSNYKDILFSEMDALLGLKISGQDVSNSLQETYAKLFDEFKDDKRMINVYGKMLEQNAVIDNKQKEIFAKNLLDLQDKYNIYEYMPFANFQLIDALKNEDNLSQAYEAANSIDLDKLNSQEKQKALYLQGSLALSLKQNNEAKTHFEACVTIDETSPWKTLCVQNLELLK
ncbi:MAG: hypothetical protein E7K04_01835 [Helicobacter sp.]|nr:hypothetical protein [Helicobacter sp.]